MAMMVVVMMMNNLTVLLYCIKLQCAVRFDVLV